MSKHVYYEILPIVSTEIIFRTSHRDNGAYHINDFRVPHNIAVLNNPIETLSEMVKQFLNENEVTLLPNEFQRKLDAHQEDPKNWPSEDDSCPCCGR